MENGRGSSHAGRQKVPEGESYAYTMHVAETVESQCVIVSDRKLTFGQLKKRTERRKDGKLTFIKVSHVETWCEDAWKNGRLVDRADAIA